MPITPKNWENSPSTATPISAEALEDLELRLSTYSDSVSGGAGAILYTQPGDPNPDPSEYVDGTLWVKLLE